VKASDRLPDKCGKENSVIVKGMWEGRWPFVAFGFRNYNEEDPRMYYEVGNKSECDNNVEWLDESGADNWISVNDQLPAESGRYWCYVEEVTDLGRGYFQWNCAYNQNGKFFTDKSLINGERITHWRPLPEAPKNVTPVRNGR